LLLPLLLWKGCLHRDLKLSNVMFDVSSSAVRIADPGLMAPFGSQLFCFSADAPHIDFCRAAISGTAGDPAAMSALNSPALDIRQLFLSALFGFIGAKNIPDAVSWRHNNEFGKYIEAYATFDWVSLINATIGPVCAASAQLLCSILAPLEQATVPSIAELLQHPLLAPLAAEAQVLFAGQRGAFQVQHHAAYLGGHALKSLLNGLPSAHTSCSSSSTGFFTRQITALQDRFSAAGAQGVTLPAAGGQCELPVGVSSDGCEMALAVTAALQGCSDCNWNQALLQAAEWEAKVLRWQLAPHLHMHPAEERQQQQQQVSSPVIDSACSTPADSPTAAWQYECAAVADFLLAAAAAAASPPPAAAWADPTALPEGALCLADLEARLFDEASSSSNSSMMPPLSTATWAAPAALPAGALRLADLEARLFDEASSSNISSMMPSLSTASWAAPSALPAGALRLADLEARLFVEASSSSNSSMISSSNSSMIPSL
jgi:hypothetical protein